MKNDESEDLNKATEQIQRQKLYNFKQFPLIFMNPTVDVITKMLTTFGSQQIYRVVYMGPRYNSNMKVFKSYCSNKRHTYVNQSEVYGVDQMNKFIFKYVNIHEKYFPIRMSEYRLFTGMNPTFTENQLKFQSDFQCGNLDLAIFITRQQYDLFMRVDSNTKGHTSWFYFKVSNVTTNQKVKFNIVNFTKRGILYKDGMKPYVYKKSTNQWTQAGISVTYSSKRLRYKQNQFNSNTNFNSNSNSNSNSNYNSNFHQYKCLSFIYQFKDTQQVYFAYCVPYSYSYLLHRLQQFSNKCENTMKINYSQSSGGLPIPILTISNFASKNTKTNILCTARLHPGQTQGSWMIDGFINYLLSLQAAFLRDNFCFKIIPMVNVDGVVIGNFRTGIMGRDLNRCFNLQNKQSYNQIRILKQIATQLNPTIFIDFHGHSAKKNVFIYGPDYKLEDKNYLLCRIYPKLISKQTMAFRYYSCSFNISKNKVSTGRAVMLKQLKVQFSYTVQASNYSYGPSKNQILFNANQYMKVGAKIAYSLNDFVRIIYSLPKSQQYKNKNNKQIISSQKYQQNALALKNIQSLSLTQKNLINQLIKDTTLVERQQKQSDGSSSDCQDNTNDYTNDDLKNIMQSKFQLKYRNKSKKQKMKDKDKQKSKTKKQTSLEASKNTLQTISKKSIISRKRSQMRRRQDEELINIINAQSIIQISNCMNFQTKTSKIIGSHPSIVNRILRKQKNQKKFFLDDMNEMQTSNILERKNKVYYDWSSSKKTYEKSSKHFQFEPPQLDQSAVSNKKKQSLRSSETQQKNQKKKIPLLSIKRSLLPALGHSVQLPKQVLEKQKDNIEKGNLWDILQQYEKKKKQKKQFRILFL